jgi:2-keto-4-pentenoate hydratase/2-oxohepta-3-ene-1,7-dioic acid hydratase in catechol pathway
LKLVLFEKGGESNPRVGILRADGAVDATSILGPEPVADHKYGQQLLMERLIDRFDELRRDLEDLASRAEALPVGSFRLLAPLPRPGKILCCIANYWEHAQREPRPLNMFLKNPDAVIGPNTTVMMPELTEPWIFMHEAELAIVIKGPVKSISQDNWTDAVFGYSCLIDVSARGEGRSTWRAGSWMGKSFDTFCPVGPCIVTADEVAEPNDLRVRLWNSGQLRHDYTTDDMEHRVPELIQYASSIMTLHSGDLIACGTNHEGLGPIQNGETLTIEIEGIGQMSVDVVDPLGREWDRGIYMGIDSTNHDAIRRYRPGETDRLVAGSDT